MTKENSSNSMSNAPLISDEMRDLIIRYMEACNAGQDAEADNLLDKIKQQGISDYESNP